MEKADRKLLYIRLAVLGLALGVIVGGFVAGGTADVLAKAVAICTECVGLG
ncbi:MAG: thioredoxin [Oscillospiraceae bacterium]|nr:thioredoxin [Oscillospiraceae bacterium]